MRPVVNGAAARAPSGDSVPTSGTASTESSPQFTPPAPVQIAPVDALSFTDDMPEFPAPVVAALRTPVRDEWVQLRAVKEGSNAELLYVPWIEYQNVLEAAFGIGGFKIVPRSVPRTEGNQVTYLGALFVRIPGTSKFHFIDESKGECNGRLGAGNAVEGAKSDCLTKCCKRLGIFKELFDPNWRRAWEKNNKGARKQQISAATWPAGRAPAQPAPGSASSTAPTPPAPSATGGGAAPAAGGASGDTGEAASDEAKQAIAGRLKQLAWKWGFMREWFSSHFAGVGGDKPVKLLNSLTQVQADAALALLMAFNQGAVYQRLIGELREKGVVVR